MKNHKKYRVTLRVYFAIAAISTLCFSCLISFTALILGVRFFYSGPLTGPVLILICLLGCLLTMILGGILMYIGSIHLTRPLEILNQAVTEIAQGDFSARILRNSERRGTFQYTNELDELSENVNTMAAELGGMDYMRRDFMSNVSHEIKTPVAAITGFTEILLDGGLDEAEQREYLTMVNQESRRLSVLCENMLQMSRLDNQQIILRKDHFRLDEQIRKCVILLSEKWQEKEIEFELDLDPVTIESDPSLLMQVWTNLVDNAIKYSSLGGKVDIHLHSDQEKTLVRIADQGIGIPKEKQEHIFDKFYQCEESHQKQGNGLGLSIVKRITELLHAEISYESSAGEGTTVTVTLR